MAWSERHPGHLATLAPWWGADVVGLFSVGRFGQAFDDAGVLRDPAKQHELTTLLAQVEQRGLRLAS